MLKLWPFLLFMGCTTPVTVDHWNNCVDVCTPHDGLKEACDEFFKGKGCHCRDDEVIWLGD